MNTFFQKKVCHDRLTVLHAGTVFGSMHPKADNFSQQFERLRSYLDVSAILAPRLGFTTDVFVVNDSTELIEGKDRTGNIVSGFYRTKEVHDGIILKENMRMPLLIMNADCTVMTLLAPNGDFAVLHLGFQNLIGQRSASLVENTIDYFLKKGMNANELQIYIGGGARACCYGFDEAKQENYGREYFEQLMQAVKERYGEEIMPKVIYPPRKGGVGFDLPLIARRQAEAKEVEVIEMEETCTSCLGLAEDDMMQIDKFGLYYSHLRQDKETLKQRGYGLRNAFVVFV